jgi:RNA polymerase sigma-70 factor, ECF subfamily
MAPDLADKDTMESDLQVVRQVIAGDVDAFEVLLRRYSRLVFATVARRVPFDEVDSVAQDTFVSAFRSLRLYEPDQPFMRWLLRIARRRCVDYWRQRRRSHEVSLASLSSEQIRQLEDAAATRSQETCQKGHNQENAGELVHRALAGLDPEDRLLVECIYFEELPLKEVAATLDWSLAKVKVRAFRARRKLREYIEKLTAADDRP